MKKLLLTLLLSLPLFGLNSYAQYEFGKTPDIHVEGKQLVDEKGHPVRFFGFMDTPSTWFNGGKWGGSYDAAGQTRCKDYFNKLFTATTDTVAGTYCNLFRLHLEPAWLGGGNTMCWYCGSTVTLYTEAQIKTNPQYGVCKTCGKKTYYKNADGKLIDPDGQEVSGEADVHEKSISKLTSTLTNVYYPIAESANSHGMYVIMRPPGVCPGTIKVDGYYQQYLIRVWDAVSKNAKVQAASGWLSLELANEPVRIVDASGNSSKTAMRDFFQPVVDKIRENGFEGIIWIPGTGWQASYADYKDYPIQDANFGYAVHNYTGWYGGSDESYDQGRTVSQYISQFHSQVPVMDTNPIVITEVDWSPKNPGSGHYNEHNEWVESNFGTWATGSTSKWGVLYKGLLDQNNNISMTLSATGCYLDVDAYIDNNKKDIVPAFKTKMEAAGKDPYEASGVACWQWYKDYYYQQHDGYSYDNITIQQLNTASINDVTVSPGADKYITINATFKSGRKTNIQQSCTYEVADPTIAKIFRGRVIGLAAGETDVVATYTDITGEKYSLTFHVIVNMDNVTIKSFNTGKLSDVVLAPSSTYPLSINVTYQNGRKEDVAASCTYTVQNKTIAKIVNGRVQALKVGETEAEATYTDATGQVFTIPFLITVTYFPLTKEGFVTTIDGNGSFTSATSSYYTYKSAKNGLAGWNYTSPINIVSFDSIKVVMASKPASTVKAALRIYDKLDLSTDSYAELPIDNNEVSLSLASLKKIDGKTLNKRSIYYVVFYTATSTTMRIREVSLCNTVEADAILDNEDYSSEQEEAIYNLNGVKMNTLQKGLNIIRQKDGKTRKIIVH